MTLIGEAFVRIRPDTSGFRQDTARQVRRELTAAERQAGGTNQQLREMERRFAGLRTAAPAIGAGIVGALGLVTVGLGKSVSAAKEAEAVQAQLANALRAQGISFEQNQAAIEARTQAISQMSGFDDELVATTFTNLVRRTGDVTKALNLSALAADVARGRNISLEAAQQLVIKASLGMAGQLRRVGIAAEDDATALQLLDLLQRKYAGSAEAYGQTAAGAQDRFRVALENTEEAIGQAVLPALTRLLNRASDWLNNQENQKRVQDIVTDAIDKGEQAAGALARTYDGLKSAVEWVHGVDPFGGKSIRDFASGVDKASTSVDRLARSFAELRTAQKNVAQGYSDIEAARQGAGPTLTGKVGPTEDFLFPKIPLGTIFPGVTDAQRRAFALAATSGTGTPAEVAAVKAEIAADKRALAFAQSAVDEKRGNVRKMFDNAIRLQGEIRAGEERLAQIRAQNEAAAEARRNARKAARQARRDALLQSGADVQESLGIAFGDAEFGVNQTLTFGQVIQAAKDADARRAAALRTRVESLTQVPERLRLQTEIAEQRFTNEEKLIPFYQRELAALDKQAAILKKRNGFEKEKLQLELERQTLRRRIRDIKADAAKDSGFTLTEFFAEVANEQRLYGSNVGAPADLSPQGARGSLGAGGRLAGATIHQHFYGDRSAGAAIITASQAARALR